MSLSFDKIDDIVSTASLTPGVTTFTFAAWIKPISIGENNEGIIIAWRKTAGSPELIQLQMIATTTFGLKSKWNTTNGAWKAPDSQITLNAWQMVAADYDWNTTSDDPIFYHNGGSVSVTESATPGGTKDATTSNPFDIGNSDSTDRTFDGLIGEAAVWLRRLTAAEHAAIYALGVQAVPDSLYFYWPMDNTGSAQATDFSGNGRNGTITGAIAGENPPTRPAMRRG